MKDAAHFLAAAALFCAPALAAGTEIPDFVEETASSGINHVYDGDWEFTVGGGVAAFDCNADGFTDILLAGGSATAKFYRNASARGGTLKFEAVTSGLEFDKVTGAYPIDIDSDGIMDVVLLRVGENLVMRGKGGCQFERANEAWGFDGGDAWSTAFSATWEKGASWPMLAIGNYVDRTEEISPWGSCTDNWLHRPLADQRKFAAPLPLKPSFCALSMLFTDWNRSGAPSLRVSNDREYYEGGQEQMWHVDHGKAPALYTAEEGWKPLRIWGMGVASYDLDFDGFPEYFLTSMADNKLQTLAAPGSGKAEFKDVAYPKGVTAHRPYIGENVKPSTAWHTQFEDVNNDGLADIFIAKGNVAKMPDFAAKDPNNLLIQQPDGKFIEAGDKAGVASTEIGRGAALADFNLDGMLDLIVVNRWSKAQLWRNTSKLSGHWIEVLLSKPAPNVNAIGAWLEIKRGDKVMRREITSGGGHASGQSGWVHVGLGAMEKAELRVVWPDGTAGEWESVAGDGFYVLERGKAARVWEEK